LAKQLYWPARYLAHEWHHAYIQCRFGNRADILEHQELLIASRGSYTFAGSILCRDFLRLTRVTL
jgi:hypothetical protein